MIKVYLDNGQVIEGEKILQLNEVAITIKLGKKQTTILLAKVTHIEEPLQKD